MTMRHLMAVSLVLSATGCSLSLDSPEYSRITIRVPARGPHLESPFEALIPVTPPATSDGFQCLAVNVVGPGIAPAFGSPAKVLYFPQLLAGTKYCTYPGITALFPNLPAGSSTHTVKLKVPSGPKRLIQMLGFYDPNGEICPLGVLDSRAEDSEYAKPFEIGRAVIDLFRDSSVVVEERWNTLSAAEQLTRNDDCKTPLEIYADTVRQTPNLIAYWPMVESGGSTVGNTQGAPMGNMTISNATLGGATGPITASTALRVSATGGAGVGAGYTFSASAFTVEMWVKIASGSCVTGAAFFQMASAGNELIELYCDASGFLNFFVADSGGGSNAIPGPPVDNGQWHHIVAGKRSSDNYLTLYFDGNNYAQSPGNTWSTNAFPFTSANTWVGFDENNLGRQPGDYAHVAIYNVAPTFAQAHYLAAGYTPPPALVSQVPRAGH